MTLTRILAGFALAVFACASPSHAQLIAAKESPIVFGHVHIVTADFEAHKKFWETLGGTAMKLGDNADFMKFPNVLVMFKYIDRKPAGGSAGTTVDHIGLSVTNLRAVVDKVKANGFTLITEQDMQGHGAEVVDDIARFNETVSLAVVLGPDDVKVELVERHEKDQKPQTLPIMLEHVHFFGQQNTEMRDWYVKVFGATPDKTDGPGIPVANLPGVRLTFSGSQTPVVGTNGRVVDEIGFEVKNLEAFTKQLEAKGITLTKPYRGHRKLGFATAFITDPWGTVIQLTEGMNQVQ